jgi:GNAT superfamily N-acetyltransferase
LEAYFEVESYDELVLSNPQTEILDKGGSIFMVLKEGKTIGTFAFLKKGEGLYEFSKMALTPKERGKGYGNLMMQFAIRYAEQHHWNSLILYSSTILKNSIYLYRKFGFKEVPIDPDIKYARGNIKMELELTN